jgi:ABC-type lipoprotein release transport system permease subunit
LGVYDGPTIVAVVPALATITVLASAVPALRVARIDPAITLREE